MKQFAMAVFAKNEDAAADALEEMARLIRDGNHAGFNQNDWASFSFTSTGQYEPEAEEIDFEDTGEDE